MKKLFFCSILYSIIFSVLLITLVILLSGCTLHFKAEKLEVETERQRVQTNDTYRLQSVDLL